MRCFDDAAAERIAAVAGCWGRRLRLLLAVLPMQAAGRWLLMMRAVGGVQ
jgi:hypothetical protein